MAPGSFKGGRKANACSLYAVWWGGEIDKRDRYEMRGGRGGRGVGGMGGAWKGATRVMGGRAS